MSTSSQEDSRRTAFIAGLRDLADWLEANPAAPTPYLAADGHAFGVPMNANAAVEEAAAVLGLDVVVDEDGNASCDKAFGGLTWHMYGYADFAEFSEMLTEQKARTWAAGNGLEIRESELTTGGAA